MCGLQKELPVRFNPIFLLLLMVPALAGASASPAEKELLAKVNATNQQAYSELDSFICAEQIRRYRGPLGSEKARAIDTITANLSYVSGVEHYSDILQNGHARPNLESFVGVWSQGEFGTLLHQTISLLGSRPVEFQVPETLDGKTAFVFGFSVDTAGSPWELHVQDRVY